MHITVDDIRAAGHCTGVQARRWFAAYGINYREFLRDGITAEALLATGDGIAFQVVERKIGRLYPRFDTHAASGNPAALLAIIAAGEVTGG